MTDLYPRGRHLGAGGPGVMLEDVPTIDTEVGLPPLPLPPHVVIVDSSGRKTTDYHDWEMKVHNWRLKLFRWSGGSV